MTPKSKKPETPDKKIGIRKTNGKSDKELPSDAPVSNTPVSNAPAAPEPAGPKRMVLKTLKRAAAAPPPSPTLHRVTIGTTRRVVPKAPPPKPKPVEVPPAKAPEKAAASVPPPPAPTIPVSAPKPVPPVVAKEVPAVQAKPPVTPPTAKSVEPLAKPIDKVKKEPAKVEPTATYKMPAPAPLKPPKPLTSRPVAPASPPQASPAATATAEQKIVSTGTEATPTARPKVRIPEILTVKELAERLNVKPIDVIKKMLGLGTMMTINQQIDGDTATLAADAFGIDAEIIPLAQETAVEEKEDPAKLKPRPPIVTIMGHVDHGKTSLLDAIRKTRVAEKEAGGITQHIGAYRVSTPKGDVVFLDTPGHEAFTAMRARGAQVTDIVVLVVAADDGVMPQTVEAIDHARAAGVTIVVAVNKIDLPTADVERIKRDLAQYQLAPEEWGGKTIFVEVSAKKGTNIDKLLEMLSLETELLELRANPDRRAQGVVVEARMDARRGTAATLLIQKGTLKVSDVIVAGTVFGRARALLDDRGNRITEAGPSTPVEVLGLSGVPQAGDRFSVLPDEREARTLVERRQLAVNEEAVRRRHVTLETLHQRVAEGKYANSKLF